MNLNRERDQRALRREHERERAEAAAETARLLVQQGTTPEVIVEDNAPTEPSHHDISQGDDPAAHTDLEEEFEQLERSQATDVGQGAQPAEGLEHGAEGQTAGLTTFPQADAPQQQTASDPHAHERDAGEVDKQQVQQVMSPRETPLLAPLTNPLTTVLATNAAGSAGLAPPRAPSLPSHRDWAPRAQPQDPWDREETPGGPTYLVAQPDIECWDSDAHSDLHWISQLGLFVYVSMFAAFSVALYVKRDLFEFLGDTLSGPDLLYTR